MSAALPKLGPSGCGKTRCSRAAGDRFGAAVIMKIAYGHQIERDDDEYIKMTENVSLAHVDAGDPGTAPVDFFPIRMSLAALRFPDVVSETNSAADDTVQYLPWWFPGCWFNRVVHSAWNNSVEIEYVDG